MLQKIDLTIPSTRQDASQEQSTTCDSPSSTLDSSSCGSASTIDVLSTKSLDSERPFAYNLSTMHLLVIHIGSAHLPFIVNAAANFASSAALTLFLATTDAVSFCMFITLSFLTIW